MTNNDVLRRLRYTFNFNDKKMIALFALADYEVTREQISNWLKREGDIDAVNLPDTQLAIFLNGLINEKRGKKDGPQHAPEKRITNNIVLTKLKIAFNLKAEDILGVLELADFRIGKAELSAFFRKPDHKHFRQCKDQVLRNFLQGLEKKFYVKRPDKFVPSRDKVADSVEEEVIENKSTNYKSAKPKASAIYVNPKAKPAAKSSDKAKLKLGRKVLKLKPEDIYKQ